MRQVKEFYQMTREEFLPFGIKASKQVAQDQPESFHIRWANLNHYNIVKQAISAGYLVPMEALSSYQDLHCFTDNIVFHTNNALEEFLLNRGFYEDPEPEYKKRGKKSFLFGRGRNPRKVVFDHINVVLYFQGWGVYRHPFISYSCLCYFILHGTIPEEAKNNIYKYYLKMAKLKNSRKDSK